MAETPAKAPPPQQAKSSGIGKFLTQQFGPLPVWAWLIVGVGTVAAIFLWSRNQNKPSNNTAGTAQDPTATDPNTGLTYGQEDSLINSGLPYAGGINGIGQDYASLLNQIEMQISKLENPPASTTTTKPPPKQSFTTYTVKSGDTIERIAEHNYNIGDNTKELAEAIAAIIQNNPALKGDTGTSKPKVGTKLKLPTFTTLFGGTKPPNTIQT